MSKSNFIEKLYHINAVRLGNFVLKSGESSSVYLDLRQIISYPNLLIQTAELMWPLLNSFQNKIQHICGVPYTALPIATCLSIQHHLPMLIRRKEKKDYGTKKIIEGVFKIGDTCCIIEDVITTGSSVLETAQVLSEVGVHVSDAIVLVDREQGGRELLQKNNINVHHVFTLNNILDKKLLPEDLNII